MKLSKATGPDPRLGSKILSFASGAPGTPFFQRYTQKKNALIEARSWLKHILGTVLVALLITLYVVCTKRLISPLAM